MNKKKLPQTYQFKQFGGFQCLFPTLLPAKPCSAPGGTGGRLWRVAAPIALPCLGRQKRAQRQEKPQSPGAGGCPSPGHQHEESPRGHRGWELL